MLETEVINPGVQDGVVDDPGVDTVLPREPPPDVDRETLVEEVVLFLGLNHLGSFLPEFEDGVHHINSSTASLYLLSQREEGKVGSCKVTSCFNPIILFYCNQFMLLRNSRFFIEPSE